jgi:hypothetical protein
MSQDGLSESFSKLNTSETSSNSPEGKDNDSTPVTKAGKENRRAVEKVSIQDRIKRLTKDPEQSKRHDKHMTFSQQLAKIFIPIL